ncbi:isocitrate lyase/phosphoenolpyruvate mutase family protein [Iodobacter sp. CM08]|uniref:isocitrate lyase/phosphoenolpyruvate mutase family protein n=1 Tax=Iodobacter sp. CM08 TaxID=3085902 RepID=UPI00298258ED|nr:isocitrate lyase/phosphoenolpyruvate mutase family protein [Iodobacter sp. CM08]MDW5417181.1 isocitrate lyase/phosphoenolpyruvate mutase family protein [Iodobacter sp. CM08]
MQIKNIFDHSSPPPTGERFEPLHSQPGLTIERIISSPRIAHTEYSQPQDEWVLLLQGEAKLDVAGETIALQSGDYLFIPALTPHTVLEVSDGAIWLAVHIGGGYSVNAQLQTKKILVQFSVGALRSISVLYAAYMEMQMNFDTLHQQATPLLLCNVWDAASAQAAQRANYQAIGTSSAAIAAMLGYPDGEALTFAELCYIVDRMIAACDLPLTVDIEAGYSRNPAQIAEHILALAARGVVGINLEDSIVSDQRHLLSIDEFCANLSQIRRILQLKNCSLFINIRTDTFLLGKKQALQETIQRGLAYQAAGADGLFVPCISSAADIAAITAAVSLPLNVMCMPELPDFATLQALGVKRISMGNFVFAQAQQQLSHLFSQINSTQSFTQVFENAHCG